MESQYDNLADYWKSRNARGYQHKIASRSPLHGYSAYITKVLAMVLGNVESIHEIGCGMGRNLDYLRNAYQVRGLSIPRLSGNDLDQAACFKHMNRDLRQRIEFHQQDTVAHLRQRVQQGDKVDLAMSSDHMIHLPPDVIPEVTSLMAQLSSRYILIKEAFCQTKPRTNYKGTWFVHQYRFEGFQEIFSDRAGPLDPHGEYEVRLLKNLNSGQLYGPPAAAESEARLTYENSQWGSANLQWAASRLEKASEGPLLDIGNGPRGLQRSTGMETLAIAKRIFQQDQLNGLPEDLPLAPESAGGAYLDGVRSRVFDWGLALACLGRVLRPQSPLALVIQPKAPGLLEKLGAIFPRRKYDPVLPPASGDEVQNLLRENGFQNIQVSDVAPDPEYGQALRVEAEKARA